MNDESKLPKWTQKILSDERSKVNKLESELNIMKQAHSILFNHTDWFTITGPPLDSVKNDSYYLFYLSSQGSHSACSLKVGDVLLIGRAQKEQNV